MVRKKNGKANQERNNRWKKQPQGAMAEALKAAGVTPEKKSKHQTSKESVDEVKGSRSEIGSWRAACKGVVKSDQKSPRSSPVGRKKNRNPSRKSKKNNRRSKATDDNTFVGIDGRQRRVVLSAGGSIPAENKKVPNNIKTEKKADSVDKLRIEAGTSINAGLRQTDEQHRYSGSLLKQISPSPASELGHEIDLVIGLDFGTTYCKAVVQEPGSGRAWAIPFSDNEDNPYILATRVLHEDGMFRLSGDGDSIGNLKLPLLTGIMPPGHALSVIAFLALVIRHIKRWVEQNKADDLAGMTPFWSVNLGLPAKDLERSELVSNFTRLIWAGMSLAIGTSSEVTKKEVETALVGAFRALKSGDDTIPDRAGGEVHKDQIGVLPEIAAQIYGYLKSDMWDRSQDMFLLIDVGGGTVDGAIFKVVESDDGETLFSFLKASVEQLGVFILHQKRLGWHLSQLKNCPNSENLLDQIKRIVKRDVTPSRVPGSINEYLQPAEYPNETLDSTFYEQFRQMAWEDLIHAVRNDTNKWSEAWKKLPFLLCGGGRSIGLYNDFLKIINRPESATAVRLNEIEMNRPPALEGRGLGQSQYQRISVAYGLSFLDIGNVLTPDMLREQQEMSPHRTYRDNYIGPEMV